MVNTTILFMKRPHLLVVFTGMVCFILALTAIFYHAPSQTSALDVIGYEIAVFIGIILILCLINERALPDASKDTGRVWP